MASVNKVVLIGNLGADPELRALANGEAVCNLRLATTEKWRDKASGEMKEATEWHRVVLYRRLAEVAAEYLRKGSAVYIEGKLRTRQWQDQGGQNRYSTEVEGAEMQLLGTRKPDTTPAPPLQSVYKDSAPVAKQPPVAMDWDDPPF